LLLFAKISYATQIPLQNINFLRKINVAHELSNEEPPAIVFAYIYTISGKSFVAKIIISTQLGMPYPCIVGASFPRELQNNFQLVNHDEY